MLMTSSIIDAIEVEFSEKNSEEVTNNVKNLLNGSYFDEMERNSYEDYEDVD